VYTITPHVVKNYNNIALTKTMSGKIGAKEHKNNSAAITKTISVLCI